MATFRQLNARRKAALHMWAQTGQVVEQSVALQRGAQRRALKAKDDVGPLSGGALGLSTPEEVHLIVALDAVIETRNALNVATNELEVVLAKTKPHMRVLKNGSGLLGVLLSQKKRQAFTAQLEQAEGGVEIARRIAHTRLSADVLNTIRERDVSAEQVLARYQQNTAAFIAAYEQLAVPRVAPGGATVSKGRHGDLPFDIANRVEMWPLDQGPLRATLRRYQDFGARYLIVQKRTLLGDDMGLGKTVQVLAAMCHLHANGSRHFFVVAPNSVLVNWQREVTKHTEMPAYLAHGANREEVVAKWNKHGGVAVTSYSTLQKIDHLIRRVDMLAVDEAHFVKNPEAQRTIAVDTLAQRSTYVALMTGTALENKVEELQNLLEIAHPGAVREIRPMYRQDRRFDKAGVARTLAHVYLRRTQADVLTELPERIEVNEWVTLTESDRADYESQPVNIMLRRRSATASVAKYERLEDLVAEHQEADRKVVVFSFFRQVLDDVSNMFGGCPQITGDQSSAERQRIIDVFTAKQGFAVLALQIEAGGVGINLQAASVVILMEAQFKPSTEWQAIARVHRMGQSRTVNVHRILATDTVEEHLVALLEKKADLFRAYAHESAIKDSSDMASDPNTASLERELLELMQAEKDDDVQDDK